MKAILASIAIVFSVSVNAMDIVKCDLNRQGYDEYSYVTFNNHNGVNRAMQIVKGSGIYAYYNLPNHETETRNGEFIMRIYGLEGHIQIATSQDILTSPADTAFAANVISEGGDETAVCMLKKPETLEDL